MRLMIVAMGCFTLGVTGCTETETVVVNEPTTGGGTTSGGGTAGGGGTTGGGTTSGGTTGGGTTGGGTTGGSETTGGGTAAQPQDVCGLADHPGLPLGVACTENDDCETGYCYEEELWNEDGTTPQRFCTAACAGCTTVGNCNEWSKATGTLENKCFPFRTAFINYYGLDVRSICLATCKTDADCVNVAPHTFCGGLKYGSDKEFGSGISKVCQPPEGAWGALPEDDFKNN